MITFEQLKEIVLLYETGVEEKVISNIYKIKPNKIKKYYLKGKKIITRSVDEVDAPTSGGGGGGTAAPAGPSNVSKWTGAAEGRANPRSQGRKWESGLSRGKANPLT